jgi:hypothetical protein
METWKKIAVGTGVGTAILAGASWLLRLNKTAVSLEVVPTAKIHKIEFNGVSIRVDVQLKNPTRSSFKLKYPFIKLSYKEESIGSSQVVNQDIVLPAFGEAQIENILIKIPLLNLFTSAGKVFTAINNNELIQLQIDTLTTIDIGIKKLPFTKTDKINLSKQKQ